MSPIRYPHVSLLNMFAGAGIQDPVGNVADHQLATMWLFRASDIAHSAKPWSIHRKWSMRVVQAEL